MFCKYCTQKDLEYIKTIYAEQIELFAHKANDALFKNFAAYDFIVTNKIKGDRCLDIGAGPSALGFLLCDYFEEVNLIDLDVSNNFVHNNLKKELGDFFNFAEKLPVNSFDVIIDACSITHFAYNNERNTGLDKCAIIIEKIIKSNGYFIMTSDVLPPFDMKNTNQMRIYYVEFLLNVWYVQDKQVTFSIYSIV